MTKLRPARPSSSRHTTATLPCSRIAAPIRVSKPRIFRQRRSPEKIWFTSPTSAISRPIVTPLIVERAKSAGAELAVNPGVRQLTARYDDFWASLKHIDILCVNRSEAQALMPRLLQSFGEGGAPLTVKSGEPVPPLAKRGLRNGGYEMTPREVSWRPHGAWRRCRRTDGRSQWRIHR